MGSSLGGSPKGLGCYPAVQHLPIQVSVWAVAAARRRDGLDLRVDEPGRGGQLLELAVGEAEPEIGLLLAQALLETGDEQIDDLDDRKAMAAAFQPLAFSDEQPPLAARVHPEQREQLTDLVGQTSYNLDDFARIES